MILSVVPDGVSLDDTIALRCTFFVVEGNVIKRGSTKRRRRGLVGTRRRSLMLGVAVGFRC